MRSFNLLIWLMQLGFSVAFPLVGFILLAAWLHNSCGWGAWVMPVGVILGVVGAVDGLAVSLKAMKTLSRNKKNEEPPVSFNDHQ